MMALPQATLPSKEAGFHDDDDSSFPVPPPYEAAAYPRVRSRRAIARNLVSPRVLVCVFFAALLAWPALLLVREATLRDVARHASSSAHLARFRDSVKHCAALRTLPENPEPGSRKSNPRWNPARGQARPVVLRNMTFFDGESVAPEPMDIRFDRGLITELATTASRSIQSRGGATEDEHDLHGRFVTPGLVDMHSHHSTGLWPALPVTSDENEMSKAYGPLTPFMRILDSMKAYDDATRIIMSGGITTSLILPGSANIMGGEGTVIKNVLKSGELGEYVVEELLLEHNIPPEARHRYMKLACGENPKRVYGHTRMANAYILREQFAKAKEHLQKQDEYCEAVASVSPGSDDDDDLKLRFVRDHGDFPSDLKLESTVGMLRGRVAMQNHCYLPEDFETMLRVTKEYGVRVRAFHHALEAWQVPEMLKAYGENVTVATFAEFSLYKFEAYAPSLSSGRILNEHGIPVAYKSDHGPASETNAKYIMFQAGVGHAFHLPEDKALQSVTSIPANAIDLGYRVGYARPGYDADLVVWDAHPLSIGATPLQVYVDGNPQLEHHIVRESMGTTFNEASAEEALPASPKMRTEPAPEKRAAFCSKAKKARAGFVINGITNTFLESHPQVPTVFRDVAGGNLTLVISDGAVACLGTPENCSSAAARVSAEPDVTTLDLSNGHVLPGLTALTASLGMVEIATEDSTGDGFADPKKDGGNPENLDFAKYGVQLEGKAFSRARLGGITRAVTPPLSEEGGFVNGVSVGILTRTDRTLLDGGVFRPEVALHVTIDDKAKAGVGSISTAVKKLRKILADGKGKHNETTFGEVASGKLPLVVNANNHWDIQQIINIKKDFPDVNIVIQGGAEAPLVALELAESQIPVILTETRPAPYSFRHRDAVVGPPLTPSVARILSEAGVYFAVAIVADIMPADYRIHDLALEAAWAAKYANLGDKEAVRLVSSNVEDILGLPKSNDIVVWEDSPLEFGGTVALSFETSKDGELEVAACWPQEHDK